MTDLPLDARERAELSALLLELGPDAPTLCEGWTTLDLAAHLGVREREPWAAAGILIERFAPLTERRRRARKATGLDACVAALRSGPPLVPWRVPGLRPLLNLNEWVIHHEDVRRANGRGRRTDRPELEDAVWAMVRRGARFMTRRITGAAIDLVRPNGERVTGKGAKPRAELRGEPVDLLLYLTGRRGAAEVAVSGVDEAVAAVVDARLGL